jgi:hypothetical protein
MSDMKRRMACTKDAVNFVDTEASVRVSENGKTNLTEHNCSRRLSLCSYFDFTSCLPANLIPVRENKVNTYIQDQLTHKNVLVYCQDTFQLSRYLSMVKHRQEKIVLLRSSRAAATHATNTSKSNIAYRGEIYHRH